MVGDSQDPVPGFGNGVSVDLATETVDPDTHHRVLATHR